MTGLGSRGVTLVELVVVLVILGVAAGVATFGGLQSSKPGSSAQRADSLQAIALESGHPIMDTMSGSRTLYLPDGRILRGGE